MFGMISKISAAAGRRSALLDILKGDHSSMPGCLSYIVAEDAVNLDAIWITETWRDKDAHRAALSLDFVRKSVELAMPLIADMTVVAETRPLAD